MATIWPSSPSALAKLSAPVLNNWVSFTGGPNGVPVPSPTLFGLEFTRRAKDGGIPIHEFFHVSYNPNLKFIFLYAVLCLLVLLVKHRLTRMPIGRALGGAARG